MAWIVTHSLTFFQRLCVEVLRCGPVPHHVAFIMDGNRRYAKKTNVEKSMGHSKGFEKLSECLQWCRELGIREVTVYAFSIENFKRSKDEVDTLMGLAREKFQKLFDEQEKLMEEGVCIRVIGNLELLPDDLRKLIAKAMLLTKDNKKSILNVAMSYTSRDEISHSIKSIIDGVSNNEITVEDITEDLISNCLYTNQSPDPDILIRTSGEVRLSDFMLWQVSKSNIYFTDVLWPEFNIWQLFKCVFNYQRSLREVRSDFGRVESITDEESNDRVASFLQELHKRRITQLELYAAA